MKIRPIKTKKDYNLALERLELIFDSKKGSPEGDELEVLSMLIENYEIKHYEISNPDPIEAIKYRMEQLGYDQKDLAKIIGQKSRASEILSKKRKLTLEMIRKLQSALQIPAEILVQAY
jgi:HTH-type transcriptional regulator/antitoxin HigA